jgi:protein JSN1
MSLSANDNGSYPRVASGKTPPPAPSAAYAKRSVLSFRLDNHFSSHIAIRARELQAEERLGAARYRPPALRTINSSPHDDLSSNPAPGDAPDLPASNYPPGFKRARAGTLPNVHLASSQRLAAAPSTATNPTSTEAFPEQPQRQTAVSITPNLPPASTSRPNLRHTTSVASSVSSSVAAERNSRLRSGSLTLPAAGLSNAFGPSIFSSAWLSNNGASNGYPVLDELRSVTSADSGADDFDVHTLDYLGLDDTHRPPPAATISELRHQAQAAVTGNLAPSRMRASTVSNPYHLRPSVPNALLSPSNAEDEEAYFDDYDEQAGIPYGQQSLSAFEGSDGSYLTSPFMAKGFGPTDHLGNSGVVSRPRAISVGVLDDPMRSLQRRSASSELLLSDASAQSQNLGIGGPTGILKTDKSSLSRNGSSSSVHFPNGDHRSYLAAPNLNNRAVSPKSESNNNGIGNNAQTQTPTRSLWIGNLDSSFTSEQLIHVFAHYGAIESLRLLPEKVRHQKGSLVPKPQPSLSFDS